MPLWSSARTASYSDSPSHSHSKPRSGGGGGGGPPQLPPLPTFTPPSTSHLPHFDRDPTSSASALSNRNRKGKQPAVLANDDEDEDDPWRDGSDDESTVTRLANSAPPPPPPPPLASPPPPTAPAPVTSTPSGWFSSFTSPFSGSGAASSSSSSSAPSKASTTAAAADRRPPPPRNTVRRQPSANDVALALASSTLGGPSPSRASDGPPAATAALKRSGGSYIGTVNEVQKAADEIVQRRESVERARNSTERTTTTTTTTTTMTNGASDARDEHSNDDESSRGGGGGGSAEKERLRKTIRPEVFELVKDPSSVLPRLRREWLTRRPPAGTAGGSATTAAPRRSASSSSSTSRRAPGTPSAPPPPRLSISSDLASDDNDEHAGTEQESDDEEGGRPRGYFALNASSLSSSTAKVVVDYQREYGRAASAAPSAAGATSSASAEPGSNGAADGIEEDLLEAPGELGRETRRRKKFLDVLQGVAPGEARDGREASLYAAQEGDDDAQGGRTRVRADEGETDLGELRKLSWGGVPPGLRVVVWMLLLGYLPSPFSRRVTTLARKRQEYADAVKLAFSRGVKGLDGPIWHQISIDVPRTRPGVKLWMVEGTQRSLERILYVWAIRHPASGYVQGINDLVTPFFQVFLSLYIDSDPEEFDPALLPPAALEALEADSFWCLSKLLDGIQDNYIFAQPGITRAVKKMQLLCERVDRPLATHLASEGVEFIQFAFRWMNCLLMRELSVQNIVRMWDTYLAEGGDAFSEFHLYVCLSFLVKWSEQLRTMDFQSIIMFLQSLPTKDWKDSNTELLLSEAFMWSRTFEAR
ncbi:hypothetical protein JCM11491_007232 [Sporobolomyces phaffii]